MGYTEVAQAQAPSGTIANALRGIGKAAEQAADITRSLLTFSRRSPAAKQPLHLVGIVADTVAMLRRMVPTSVTMTINTASAQDLWVLADSSHIRQVVMNLTINARDAMPNGGALTVTVSRGHHDSGDTAVVTVADSGVGMSAEVVERLFEPFFTTKARSQGTGLGMAIVHGVIQDHGGTIQVASEPGQGTCITITLPTCAPGPPSPASADDPHDSACA